MFINGEICRYHALYEMNGVGIIKRITFILIQIDTFQKLSWEFRYYGQLERSSSPRARSIRFVFKQKG